MSKDWYQDVMDFHVVAGHYIGDEPHMVPIKTFILRGRLIKEEIRETMQAMTTGDLVEIADGIVDSIVVLLGTAISYGIDIRPVWDEVHKTNMAKIGGGKDSQGKSLKPTGWQPPDIARIINGQLMGGEKDGRKDQTAKEKAD